MAFRVKLTDRANHDLDGILAWLLAQQAGAAGGRWFQKLNVAVASLSELPQRCPRAPESAEFPFEVRELVYGRKPHQYRVFFTIEGEDVVVLHIRHGRRRPLSR